MHDRLLEILLEILQLRAPGRAQKLLKTRAVNISSRRLYNVYCSHDDGTINKSDAMQVVEDGEFLELGTASSKISPSVTVSSSRCHLCVSCQLGN